MTKHDRPTQEVSSSPLSSKTGVVPVQDIREQLDFALYRATHAITRAYREPLQRLGLTYTQYLILLALWEQGPLSMGELARSLDLDMGACTPVVKRLELGGLLIRQRDERDERRVQVEAAPGADALRGPCASLQQEVGRHTGLSARDLRNLTLQLHRIANTLREAVAEQR